MLKAFKLYWKNYFNFRGVSKRSEYWWMQLINAVIFAVFVLGFGGIGIITALTSGKTVQGFGIGALIGIIVAVVYALAAIIPGISLVFRRYRDAGVTPWWLLATAVLPALIQVSDFYDKYAWLRTIVFIISVINFIILVLPSKNKD
ncbi:MAG: DUF805 domain-containing protein [Apilactobacillus sp.]|uniref:DUF805 domain-containing protein n=1 Tax=Apilactobacillus TaxID=2767877 RepID=UPI0025F9E0E1|nr:DUF805 domain-containing protein [Apilactobacillus sp.]MCT6822954.1 DUF805 domain-containing protein [Apilactobacillus sp.]MCT6857992.1 DUF805 domain-containing protein [Apilactobacillus sp.]